MIDDLIGLEKDNVLLSGHDQEYLKKIYVKELGRRLHLSGLEARAFAQIFKGCSWDGYVVKTELASFWKNDLSTAGTLFNTLQLLETKGLITRKNGVSGKTSYNVPPGVSRDIYNNCAPTAHTALLDAYGLADRISELIQSTDHEHLSFDDGYHMICGLIERHQAMPFCRSFTSWCLKKEEAMFLAYMYAITLLESPIIHTEYAVNKVLGHSGRSKAFLKMIQQKNGTLFQRHIIRHADEEFETGNRIMFTDECLRLLFEENELAQMKTNSVKSTILPLIKTSSITPKKLHYNAGEEKNILQISQCLQEHHYQRICAELQSTGHHPGITVLLYGPPGTGKTETVLQLARQSGRDIFKVDIATLRDKYVGESEKQVKRIFEQYQQQLRSASTAPILLMNEADGIISTRTRQITQSTDQMHNAMQNIFLEELERFRGILIATTNFADKLDHAFERRFLYKLKLGTPEAEIRTQIILDRIQHLEHEQARHLAMHYSLSGGQLDNISRKIITAKLLEGHYPSFEEIENFFRAERLQENNIKRVTGFHAGQKNSDME